MDLNQTAAPGTQPVTLFPTSAATGDPSQVITHDVLTAAALGTKLRALAVKGDAAAVLNELGLDAPQIGQLVVDASEAIPAIKAGYKTTEFWLVVLFGAANAFVFLKTGKTLPLDFNATFGGVLSAYAGFRTMAKKNPTASTSETQTTAVTSTAPVAITKVS